MPYQRSYRILLLLAIAVIAWWTIAVTPFVDNIYVPYIYPAVHYGITGITYALPFSIGDILYSASLVFGIAYAVRRIRTLATIHGWLSFIEKTLFTICLVYLVFLLMWGMNYYRTPIHDRYNVNAQNHDVTDYAKAALYFAHVSDSLLYTISDTDAYMDVLSTADWKKYTPYIGRVRVKNTVFPKVLDWMGVDGYFNPFTGEGQVQPHLPAILMPFTRVHEAAHACGIASEDDANWCAYNAGINSTHPQLVASASFCAMMYVLHALRYEDTTTYRIVKKSMPIRVQATLKEVQMYYMKHQSPADVYSRHVFNAYLKVNGEKEGIAAYNNLADWAVSDLQNKKRIPISAGIK